MYLKEIVFYLFAILLLGGCAEKTSENNISEVININPYVAEDYINLSEFVDSIEYIKLQVNDDDIMGRVREIVIKKKYIYAIDVLQQIIFVFDKKGNFVAKLDKRGEGPDEYAFMGLVYIDDNEEYIELINSRGKEKTTMLKYSNISFELIDILSFPFVVSNSSKKSKGIYYFATQQIDNVINGKATNANLIVVDENKKLEILFDKNIETNNNYFSFNPESFVKNDKGEIFFSQMYDNTFYQLEAGKAFPVFTVDFGGYAMDNAVGLKSTKKQLEYIEAMKGLASFPILDMNNTDIMSFSYFFKQEKGRIYKEEDLRHYIRFKKDDVVYHVNKIKNDITDFPSNIVLNSFYLTHEVWSDDYLVDIVLPYYRLPDEKVFVENLGEITREDDPIIVMMKLKNR